MQQPTSRMLSVYQLVALYYLRDRDNGWRPYIAGGVGFTHDSNSGANPSRLALGFGLGGGVTYALSQHFGLRGDARWMPSYAPTAGPRDLYSIDIKVTQKRLHVRARQYRGD